MNPFIPTSLTRFFFGRAVREGARDEEVGTFSEQVLARAAGSPRAGDDLGHPSRPGKYLIPVD